jgi:hypothetical protein
MVKQLRMAAGEHIQVKSNHGIVQRKVHETTLGILLLFVALNAFGGGYYGMAGARDVPVEWLEGTPFHNYFLPAFVLFLIIGGSSLLAAVAVFNRSPLARKATLVAGTLLLGWLSIQVALIGYVSWMQPVTAIASFIILYLTPSITSR